VAFYIVTKGEHPFGKERYRLGNLLDGNPVGLSTLKDLVLKDLLSWMLSHDPNEKSEIRNLKSESAETPLFSASKEAI
jgi:hypothetical protein